MPAFPATEIAHVASTDHRVLRAPEPSGEGPPGPAPAGAPLVLVQADQLDPGEVESMGREQGIALAIEGQMVRDPRLRAETGGKAQALLDRALSRRPDDLVARLARARSLRLQGRLREAMAGYEELLRSDPGYEPALDEAATLALELGDRRAALSLAGQAVALNPWSSGTHEQSAKVFSLDRNWSEAAREAAEALRLNPFQPLPRVILIQSHLRRSDLTRARQELETLIALHPSERAALERWFTEQRRAAPTP
jgi:Flp pilus assembly protein TadD